MLDHLPMFPTDALPNVLRYWVEGEAHATQTPADLAAWGAISVCASRLARHVIVEPRPGWVEPTNIFAAILLGPGNRKSAVFKDATRPLRQIEREMIETAGPIVAKLKSRRRQAEARLKKLEQQLSGSVNDDLEMCHEAELIVEELAREREPVLPVLLVDDVTGEKLAMLLAEQGGRIMSASPEGGVFDLMAGRYSKTNSADFDIYLKGHAGDDHIAHRVSRDPVYIERATITTFYAIQPEVLRSIVTNSTFRGRGLLARFCFAAPVSQIGNRVVNAKPISQKVADDYHQLVSEIGDFDGEHVLRLSDQAQTLFLDWELEVENMLANGGEMESVLDWGAKLAGATLRIAAVLHCAQHSLRSSMEQTTVSAAIRIARYLIPHAKYVLTEMSVSEDDLTEEEYLLRWLRARGGVASVRDLSHSGPRRFRNKVVLAEFALNKLKEVGLGEWEFIRPGSQGGRPTRLFRLFATGPGTTTTIFPVNSEVSVPAPLVKDVEKASNGYTTDYSNQVSGDGNCEAPDDSAKGSAEYEYSAGAKGH